METGVTISLANEAVTIYLTSAFYNTHISDQIVVLADSVQNRELNFSSVCSFPTWSGLFALSVNWFESPLNFISEVIFNFCIQIRGVHSVCQIYIWLMFIC
jgi:hypothetical protein